MVGRERCPRRNFLVAITLAIILVCIVVAIGALVALVFRRIQARRLI